jgi:hypothetical protein
LRHINECLWDMVGGGGGLKHVVGAVNAVVVVYTTNRIYKILVSIIKRENIKKNIPRAQRTVYIVIWALFVRILS